MINHDLSYVYVAEVKVYPNSTSPHIISNHTSYPRIQLYDLLESHIGKRFDILRL